MTDETSGPTDPLLQLAEDSRLFAIEFSAPGDREPVAFAVAERVYFVTRDGQQKSNVLGASYDLLKRLFDTANPELITRAVPIPARSDRGHRGLLGEVNLEVNPPQIQVND